MPVVVRLQVRWYRARRSPHPRPRTPPHPRSRARAHAGSPLTPDHLTRLVMAISCKGHVQTSLTFFLEMMSSLGSPELVGLNRGRYIRNGSVTLTAQGQINKESHTTSTTTRRPRQNARTTKPQSRGVIDSPCECEHNNPDFLYARLSPLVLAVAVTMDETYSLVGGQPHATTEAVRTGAPVLHCLCMRHLPSDVRWLGFEDLPSELSSPVLGEWVDPHRERHTIPQGQTSSPPQSFLTPTAKARPNLAAIAMAAETAGTTHRERPQSSSSHIGG